MIKQINNARALRSKGVRWPVAVRTAGVPVRRIVCAAIVVCVAISGAFFVDALADARAEPYKALAEENLRALNHAMRGGTFGVEREWKAIFTCEAREYNL